MTGCEETGWVGRTKRTRSVGWPRRRCLDRVVSTGCLEICTVSRRYRVWLGARARPPREATLQQQRAGRKTKRIVEGAREKEGESGGGSSSRATCCVVSDATR